MIRDFPARLRLLPDRDSSVDWILSIAVSRLCLLSSSGSDEIRVPVTVMLSVILTPCMLSRVLVHVWRQRMSLLSLFIRSPAKSPNSSNIASTIATCLLLTTIKLQSIFLRKKSEAT